MALSETCKFEVEQIVKVIQKVQIRGPRAWVIMMDDTIGKEGRVIEVIPDLTNECWIIKVRIWGGSLYWYAEDALEYVEFPENYCYYTVNETKGEFVPALPDYVLTSKDKINFGTAKFDLWEKCNAHAGKAVKDVVCKGAQAYVTTVTTNRLKSTGPSDTSDGFRLYTPKDKFAGGTEVSANGGFWKFADLDGEPVPAYTPGSMRPKYRKPKAECVLYKTWVPSGPGDLRPEGLQYRRKEYGCLWKTTKVAGKPVEQGDIDAFDYRVPK